MPACVADVAVAVRRRDGSPRSDADDARARSIRMPSEIDCGDGVLTPGLVDSHTHAVFGRARFEEQELRARGRRLHGDRAARRRHPCVGARPSRAQRGRAVRARAAATRRSSPPTASTTVEIKSGYGLSLDDELKIAARDRAARRSSLPVRLVPTWLGAHEIPLESRASGSGRPSTWILLVDEIIPVVAAEKLARFADVFCEPGVFTVEETRAILDASRRCRPRNQAARGRAASRRRRRARRRASARPRRIISRPSRDHGNQGPGGLSDSRHAASGHDALPR